MIGRCQDNAKPIMQNLLFLDCPQAEDKYGECNQVNCLQYLSHMFYKKINDICVEILTVENKQCCNKQISK